ncbi:hypothetical protein AB1Y20_010112 [Prymnesium parvum]|uniref:Uncharacterized protein n=1 Tax=Prymnesium parvum TaxID=97485 RepID=A0AB34K5W4_PRYPA
MAAELCQQLRALLLPGENEEPRTWAVHVRPSVASGAGEGVFLEGCCPAGQAVALYGGVSYQVDDLPVMHEIVLRDNSYVLARRDGVLIDGRPHGPSGQIFEAASRRDAAALRTSREALHPFAVGHKVNHPPAGTAPNVTVQPLDLTAEDADLIPLIPTYPFRPPAQGELLKQTAVLVASRRLQDEELWLNYKLRPETKDTWESWYTPVEHNADTPSCSATASTRTSENMAEGTHSCT